MNLDNVHIITYSNRLDKLEHLQKSESIFNTNVEYIINDDWEGFHSKLIEVKKKISSFNDTDIVIFIDAWDVLINSNKSEIVSKFLSYNCDFLVSAELNPFPKHYHKKFRKLPDAQGKNIFINSGGYMGYVKNIKLFLEWKSIDEIKKICKVGGDQTYLVEYYLANHDKISIKSDKKSLIFHSMYLVDWKDIEFREGRAYSLLFNTYPCFVHFNGGTWKAKEPQNNIMPVFNELLIKSKENKDDKYNLNNAGKCEFPKNYFCTIHNKPDKYRTIRKL